MIRGEVTATCIESGPAKRGNAHVIVLCKQGTGYQGKDQYLQIRCGGKLMELGQTVRKGDTVKATVMCGARPWTNPQNEVIYFDGCDALALTVLGKKAGGQHREERAPGVDDGDELF